MLLVQFFNSSYCTVINQKCYNSWRFWLSSTLIMFCCSTSGRGSVVYQSFYHNTQYNKYSLYSDVVLHIQRRFDTANSIMNDFQSYTNFFYLNLKLTILTLHFITILPVSCTISPIFYFVWRLWATDGGSAIANPDDTTTTTTMMMMMMIGL